MTMRGKFITLEGGEGSGKSTQAKLLFDALNSAGISALHTREPGGTDGAEEIRSLLVRGETGRWDKLTETLLYFAARRDHVEKLIKPSLDRGEWVICDRFTDSTVAYQCYGEGVSIELVNGLQKIILNDFVPDMTLILDIESEKGIARTRGRAGEPTVNREDRYERMGGVFHRNVRRGFLEVAKTHKNRCLVVNAEKSIKELHAELITAVNRRFGLGLHMLPLVNRG